MLETKLEPREGRGTVEERIPDSRSLPIASKPDVAPLKPTPLPLYATLTPTLRTLITITVMAATLMEFLDTSIVNVALPSMMGSLGATLDQIGWVSTGYIITNVIVLPLTGWLSDYLGRKKYLLYSIILFTVASFGCGMSRTLVELVFWRVIQGAGGAAFLATAQATLMEIYPPHQRAAAQAIFAIGVVIAPTLGPTLGGWITDNYSWAWIFFINVPVGIVATILTYAFIPDSSAAGAKRRADFVGIGLLAIGLGCLQTVLERGERDDWFDAGYIVALTVIAAAACSLFVWWVLRRANPYPAVNLRVVSNRNLAAGTVYGFAFGFIFYGVIFIVPQFLQQVQGHTAQQAGLILLPGALFTGLMLPLVARLMGRTDARLVIGVGMMALIGSMFLFWSRLTLTMPDGAFLLPLILRGVGTGLQLVPLSIVALGTLPPTQVAEGAGLYNLFRQLGGSLGIAMLTTLLDRREHYHYARMTEHLAAANAAVGPRLAKAQMILIAHGISPANASRAALGLLERTIDRQANVLAFQDVFLALLCVAAGTILLLALFQRPKAGPQPAADVH